MKMIESIRFKERSVRKLISLLAVFVFCCSLFSVKAYSYGRYSSFEGEWKATVGESREPITVSLELYVRRNSLEGKFEILTETGGDITKGMSFDIAGVEVTRDRLSFIVPLFDEDDRDNLVFDLKLNWRGLTGTMHEMHRSSNIAPITFIKSRRGLLF